MSETENPLLSRPDLTDFIAESLAALKRNKRLPDRLVELMRLRVAYRNQCRPCMSARYNTAIEDGLTEAIICSLEKPAEASDLSAAEKAAVLFADKFAVDHLATHGERQELARHFSAEEIAEITVFAGFFVGFGRATAVWDDGSPLPVGNYRSDGEPLVPWGIAEPSIVPA